MNIWIARDHSNESDASLGEMCGMTLPPKMLSASMVGWIGVYWASSSDFDWPFFAAFAPFAVKSF